MDRREKRRWMSLLAGCAMLVATQLPVAHADPPLTQAPGCIKGWAAYTCMSGESVTGKALLFQTLPFNARLGPFCG